MLSILYSQLAVSLANPSFFNILHPRQNTISNAASCPFSFSLKACPLSENIIFPSPCSIILCEKTQLSKHPRLPVTSTTSSYEESYEHFGLFRLRLPCIFSPYLFSICFSLALIIPDTIYPLLFQDYLLTLYDFHHPKISLLISLPLHPVTAEVKISLSNEAVKMVLPDLKQTQYFLLNQIFLISTPAPDNIFSPPLVYQSCIFFQNTVSLCLLYPPVAIL